MTGHFDSLVQDLPALGRFPRAALTDGPTAIEPLRRLGAMVGVDLLVKRDDTLPLAMGGNKVRQLEFYLGEALRAGADTVLITGAVQSNFVRLCAAGCRKLGLRPVVQLEQRVPKQDVAYNTSGNVLLLRMLGAEITTFPEGEDEAAADANLDRMATALRAEGAVPYVVHLGIDHPPVGGLGYVAAAVETLQQSRAEGRLPDHVVVASGSALTHAGFLVGARLMGWDVPVHGICVRRAAGPQRDRVLRRARELAAMLGGAPQAVRPEDIRVDDTCLAPGYGRMNDRVAEALTLSATLEALLTDPVYSGRALAGALHLARSGAFDAGDSVLFLHTGGVPAIFGYQSDLEGAPPV
jgi:D-cysteine desulfhydrase/L-cysteate sulfo-lyase